MQYQIPTPVVSLTPANVANLHIEHTAQIQLGFRREDTSRVQGRLGGVARSFRPTGTVRSCCARVRVCPAPWLARDDSVAGAIRPGGSGLIPPYPSMTHRGWVSVKPSGQPTVPAIAAWTPTAPCRGATPIRPHSGIP